MATEVFAGRASRDTGLVSTPLAQAPLGCGNSGFKICSFKFSSTDSFW